MSALGAAQLSVAGVTSVQDVAHEVPGLSMRSAGPGLTEFEVRGIASNGGAAPTVGFYLDEIPLSPPAVSQSGKVVIDPTLYDLDRIEVLRGPQGTLYGSGSMGGTVKVVTNQPKLGRFEGSAQATLSDTEGGGGNYSANLMLNIPFGDKVALRLVGGDLERSGWIDNVALNPFPIDLTTSVRGDVAHAPVQSVIKNANDERLWGGRIGLLIQPNENLSILLTDFEQRMAMGGYDLLDGSPTGAAPSRVYNAHYEAFPLREGIHDDISIYGLTINANVGFADLTSATAYWDRLNIQMQDASESIYWTNNHCTPLNAQPPCTPSPVIPFGAVPYTEKDPSRQFSQELRLTSHEGGPLHWVAGAFYSEMHSVWIEESHLDLNTQVPGGVFFDSYNPYKVEQIALFADGSYKLNEEWKLALGLRWYKYKSEQHEAGWGFDGPNPTPPAVPQVTTAKDQGYNPRINLSYAPTKDLTVYGTAAKGFRPGGANQILPPPTEPPYCQPGALAWSPDTVWNYELGEKARLLDNRLTINGDVYYIRWNGVQQVITLPCGYQYYDNAGDGRAYGPEIEINARLARDWTLTLTGAWTDSKVTSPNAVYTSYLTQVATKPDGVTPPCAAGSGCTVPIMNVPKTTASASLTYTTDVYNDYHLTARLADSYVGASNDVAYYFGYELPSYNISSFRFIVAHAAWSANLFVDNLTNKVALVTANNTSFQFNIPQLVRYSTNQPRTIGVQMNYSF